MATLLRVPIGGHWARVVVVTSRTPLSNRGHSNGMAVAITALQRVA